MFGRRDKPEDNPIPGVDLGFLNDMFKRMDDGGGIDSGNEEQIKEMLDKIIDKQSKRAAVDLFEGVAIHYGHVAAGRWHDAQIVAMAISQRARDLALAHSMQVLEQQEREEKQAEEEGDKDKGT